MFWFIVFLLILGAGFYFYQKVMVIEREIRAEQEEERMAQADREMLDEDKVRESAEETISEPLTVIKKAGASQTADSFDVMLLQQISEQPGIKQTSLYPLYPDFDKKQLQQLLKEMTDAGKIKREKQGSSYLLFPND